MNPNDSAQHDDQLHVQDLDTDSESEGAPPLASESDGDDFSEADTVSLTSDEETDGGDVQTDTTPATGVNPVNPISPTDLGRAFPANPIAVPPPDTGVDYRPRRLIDYRPLNRPPIVRRRIGWLSLGDPRNPQSFHAHYTNAVQALLDEGTIQPSRTPWPATAVHPHDTADDSEP